MGAPQWPRRGEFEWQALAGAHEVDPADLVDRQAFFGLPLEAGYAWGTVRDDRGEIYSYMRRVGAPGTAFAPGEDSGQRTSLGSRMVLMSTTGDDPSLTLHLAGRRTASTPELTPVLRDGQAVWEAAAADGRGPLSISVGPAVARYVEADVLELHGSLVSPGLQWYLPGRDAATYYVSQIYRVSGRVLGTPVEGFFAWEQAYLPPGGVLYAKHDALVGAALELTWCSYATEWDDGSIECGHMLSGHDRFGVGVRTDGATVLATGDNEATVTRSADGYWHDGVRYRVFGADWEWVPDPRGRMTALGRMPNPQQEGLMRRTGETRQPVAWMAWGETVPAHGETRRRRYGSPSRDREA